MEEALAADLEALAHPFRIRLLDLLTRPCYGEEIAEALGTSRQAALRHVERLVERGFVRTLNGRRASGPVVEYQVVPQRLVALGVTLGEFGRLAPQGGPQVRRRDATMEFPAHQGEAAAAHPGGQLLVLSGPLAGRRILVADAGGRVTLGRDPENDLALANDPFVSGRHAEIEVSAGAADLIDAFSANGTFVNLGRVPRGGRVPLAPGDVIGVGHTLIAYQRA